MSELFILLICCTILVVSDGSDCPQHVEFLNHPGHSLIYTRHHNGTLSSREIVCPGNYIFSAKELKCVEIIELEVKCTRSGRIIDSNSKNCTTYLICTQLKDGNYSSNRVSCPTGTIFSPIASRCVSANTYTCLETYESLESSGCKSNGRFSDPNSFNCSSYLICTQLEDGSYKSTQVMCPSGTIFSSDPGRCISSINYTCPRHKIETYKSLQDSDSSCKSSGRFTDPNSSNCSSYLICTQLKDGSYSSNKVLCPSGTLFAPAIRRCTSNTNYICPTLKNAIDKNFQSTGCKANGRFPVQNSTNCRSYKICTQLEDDSFTSNEVACPTGTLFSDIANRCVSNSSYTCPGNQTDTHEKFQTIGCLGSGRFIDPKSINCSSYLICTRLQDGSYSSTKVACPTGTIFSSNVSRCTSSASYTCPRYQHETTENLQGNVCQANGRYPDPTSLNCSSYLICTQLADGSFSSNQVTCPTGTLYSSNVNRCVSNLSYICPGIQNRTLENLGSNGCIRNGRFPDPNSSNCSSYLICTKLEDGRFSSNTVTCPSGTIFSPNVNRCISSSKYTCRSCNKEGLFPNPNSTDCSTYISCSRDLVSETLKCPQYTLFSIEKRACIIACDVTCYATQ